mgnify:CR=1 FL=1
MGIDPLKSSDIWITMKARKKPLKGYRTRIELLSALKKFELTVARLKRKLKKLEKESEKQGEYLELKHELDCQTNYTYKWNDNVGRGFGHRI